jgi:hypothetical protein
VRGSRHRATPAPARGAASRGYKMCD